MIALTWIVSESWITLVLHQHCLKHCPRLRLYIQEGSVYFLEGGPFLRVPPPAAQHDLVERVRTQHRLRQVNLHEGVNKLSHRYADLYMYVKCLEQHSPVFFGPWKTLLCFLSPARQWAESRVAPCRSSVSPTESPRRPTHHWLWWTYPAQQKVVICPWDWQEKVFLVCDKSHILKMYPHYSCYFSFLKKTCFSHLQREWRIIYWRHFLINVSKWPSSTTENYTNLLFINSHTTHALQSKSCCSLLPNHMHVCWTQTFHLTRIVYIVLFKR